MEPRLIQQQTQKQILSPQIRQYLRLLQMPMMELSQAVETELTENPMLEEISSSSGEEESLISPSPSDTPPAENGTTELQLGEANEVLPSADDEVWTDYDYADLAGRDPKDMQKRRDYQESLLTKSEALSDFLLWQVRFLNLNESDKKIAEEIIGNINEEGYLQGTVEEIATICHTSQIEVEKILMLIQQFDPPGIGARSLQEALILQLKKKGAEGALALEIVSKHLSLLEKRDWQQISRILSVNEQEIKNAAQLISRLEPKPGRTFYSEEPIAITPDATISFGEEDEGKLKIEVHDESIPELRVNPYYRRLLRSKSTDEKAKVFLREKLQSAINFMKALTLRKSTLHEITEEIIKAQPEFFYKGFSHLQPLRLKDIAQNLGIHESTVSRAIQGKYISTPQGTIPYKSFFSTKLETTSGEAESQKSIMEKIRSLIDKEDAKTPLSDQEIMARLQQEGIVIARRTVAKYRELLKVLPSHLRRQK